MIAFATYILDKTSTDETLFIIELRKLIIRAESENKEELKIWCLDNYGNLYKNIIINTFIQQ